MLRHPGAGAYRSGRVDGFAVHASIRDVDMSYPF